VKYEKNAGGWPGLIGRRDLIVMLGGPMAAWPHAARAQQPAKPVVGYLTSLSSSDPFLPLFRDGLRTGGYVEGQNVVVEYRSADGNFEKLPALADELVRRSVSVIVANGGLGPARRRRPRHPPSRSSSMVAAAMSSKAALSRASIGRAATSRA